MDSDDDLQLSSSPPHEEPSPSTQGRKLKRLKKSSGRVPKSPPPATLSDEGSYMFPPDSLSSGGLASSQDREFEELDGSRRTESDLDALRSDKDHAGVRRDLEFDSEVEGFDGRDVCGIKDVREEIEVLRTDRSEKEMPNLEGSMEKKKSKKRVKDKGDNDKPKPSTKRREEKERKAYLLQLHADSQRLLRETSDAAFKPIPVVQKPISSVLEKIRKRKLEISKKATILNNNGSNPEKSGALREIAKDNESEFLINVRGHDNFAKSDNNDMLAHRADVNSDLDASSMDGSNGSASQSNHESLMTKTNLDEKSMPAFRAPVDDTEDLYFDSQGSDTIEELPSNQHNSPLEEVLAPSLLTMNLKLDSAPPDDVSIDDEDNEKEGCELRRCGLVNLPSSPNGDPVKAFVDDEAEEEGDSDNDQRFQESEDEDDTGEVEEFIDLIATADDEKAADIERCNQLHQQWLERQDAAGTENLLQRLNYGSKQREPTLLIDRDDEEIEEELGGEDADDNVTADTAKINTRKIKQMIPQMFTEKDDAFLSSDDEETEKRLVKLRVLEKAEEQVTFLSPAEDESSREVFCLIKKLNTVPDTRKKAKTSSLFDTMLTGGNSNSNSKSSFLGRMSNQSLPSSHKRASSTVRSFIFGRDDSNSGNPIAALEDPSQKIQTESRPSRNPSAKFVGSRSKSINRSTKAEAKTVSGSSLFEILRRSSTESNHPTGDTMAGLSERVFSSFKCTKKSIKVERTKRI